MAKRIKEFSLVIENIISLFAMRSTSNNGGLEIS
jgi:hypothetical protein